MSSLADAPSNIASFLALCTFASLHALLPQVVDVLTLELDLNVNTSWKVKLHQLINGLRCEVLDVYHPLMRPSLKVLSRVLVHMR